MYSDFKPTNEDVELYEVEDEDDSNYVIGGYSGSSRTDIGKEYIYLWRNRKEGGERISLGRYDREKFRRIFLNE